MLRPLSHTERSLGRRWIGKQKITLGGKKLLPLVPILTISSRKLVEETSVFLSIYTSRFVNFNSISPEGDDKLIEIHSSSRHYELATAVRCMKMLLSGGRSD
jgi:hypothetical protein